MSDQFAGYRVLVTGAGAGMGREICLAFAAAGAALVVADIREDHANDTARLIEEMGGRALALAADVANPESVNAMFAAAFSAGGAIDLAVNNAGVSQTSAPTGQIDLAEWQRVVNINLTGTWLCMREEINHMLARGKGAIVNIASIAALQTLANQSAYVASKHGVAGLTRNAAVEYADRGIRINAVCPGTVLTSMFDRYSALLEPQERERARADAASRHPMGRVGTAREIADAVLFLCSDAASFVTGQCLGVDGGRSAL